jgi:hypothetical protein
MNNGPHTPLSTTLMFDPSGRAFVPAESGPRGRPRGEARWTAGGAQAISTPAKVVRKSSQTPYLLLALDGASSSQVN